MALVTVTGNVVVILGLQPSRTFSSGTVRFMLVMPPRVTGSPTVPGLSGPLSLQVDVPVASDGSFSAQVQGNDGISPAGTVYAVMYHIPNVSSVPQFFNITGTNFNLSAASAVTQPLDKIYGIFEGQLVNTVFAGPVALSTNPVAMMPTFRKLVGADLAAGLTIDSAGNITLAPTGNPPVGDGHITIKNFNQTSPGLVIRSATDGVLGASQDFLVMQDSSGAALTFIQGDGSVLITTRAGAQANPLGVFGTTDVIQVRIRANSTQTADVLQVQNSINASLFAVSGAGLVATYGGTATVTRGLPPLIAQVNSTGLVAAVALTTLYAVPAARAGLYEISWSAVVTTAATTSSTLGGASTGFQVTYTDSDTAASATTPLAAAPAAGMNQAYSQTNQNNTVGTQVSGVVMVNAQAGTTIQYAIGYTSVGGTAMAYALHIRVKYLG